MAQREVLVPDALHDPDNPRQPWASLAVKAQLVDFACREEYSADVMFGISAANQEAAQARSSVFLQAPEEEEHEVEVRGQTCLSPLARQRFRATRDGCVSSPEAVAMIITGHGCHVWFLPRRHRRRSSASAFHMDAELRIAAGEQTKITAIRLNDLELT